MVGAAPHPHYTQKPEVLRTEQGYKMNLEVWRGKKGIWHILIKSKSDLISCEYVCASGDVVA